jgi:hypothetical protein
LSQQFNVSPGNLWIAVDYIADARPLALFEKSTDVLAPFFDNLKVGRTGRSQVKFLFLKDLAGAQAGRPLLTPPGLRVPHFSRFSRSGMPTADTMVSVFPPHPSATPVLGKNESNKQHLQK